MEYEVFKWHKIESKSDYAQFVHHFNMLQLDGKFEYETAKAKSNNELPCWRTKKQMLESNQYIKDWSNSDPFIRIRFIPA